MPRVLFQVFPNEHARSAARFAHWNVRFELRWPIVANMFSAAEWAIPPNSLRIQDLY